jgi:hypothetical protein
MEGLGWIWLGIFGVFSVQISAQRKIPNLSFQEYSLEFADANRSYDEYDQYLDTLHDEYIIGSLAKILNENENLIIQLSGHCALNEDTLLANQRAEFVKERLLEKQVHSDQLIVKSYANRRPIISDAIILGLDSKVEMGAANQKNRRVEIQVVGVKKDE